MSITEHMTSEHKRCDLLYLAAEKAALEGDWSKSREEYQKFHQSMKEHFEMEEKILFPDFDEIQGTDMGPTHIMRLEHEQMNTLMNNIQTALDAEDKDEFLGEADTLLMFMQQHNAKEEMMLYPLSDQVLAAETDHIISRMQALVES